MANPQELYGRQGLNIQYTTIDRAVFESSRLDLPEGQGTVNRMPSLSVMVATESGKGNTVTIPHDDAIRLIAEVGKRYDDPMVQVGRTVPSLDGVAVMVLYDGTTPVALGLVSETAQAVVGTYAGEAREQLGSAARTGMKAAKAGLGRAFGALSDLLKEEK